MLGSPGIIQDHTRLPPSFLDIDALMAYTTALIRKLRYAGHWCAWLTILMCYQWVFVQPSTGRRPVDWCRNKMCVLYGKNRIMIILKQWPIPLYAVEIFEKFLLPVYLLKTKQYCEKYTRKHLFYNSLQIRKNEKRQVNINNRAYG